jgi:hypothetical protein
VGSSFNFKSKVERLGGAFVYVVQELASITLSTGVGLGFGGGQFACGAFAQLAQVRQAIHKLRISYVRDFGWEIAHGDGRRCPCTGL